MTQGSLLDLKMGREHHVKFEAGVFLIDKPEGLTSFSVVSKMRKILGIKKVGHAGTLDPFATGLLIVCGGRPATKLISGFMKGDKEYFATLQLGVETETQDTEGNIIARREIGTLTADDVERSLKKYRGAQKQVPPAFSALKHKGKPLYYYARKGIEVKKEAREVEIHALERTDGPVVISGEGSVLPIRVVCTKGTYIRTLGSDIGNDLGCGAHLIALRRTKSGVFSVDEALTWEDLNAEDAYKRCLQRMLTVEQVSKLLQ